VAQSEGLKAYALYTIKAIQNAHNNRCGVENMQDGVLFWFELDISDENIEE
jgi:acyl-CoA-binding protein